MKNISFNRIGLLLKRYFYENWKKDLIVAAIIFAVEMLTSISEGVSSISWFVLAVFFVLYTGRIFSMLGKPQGAVNYLMLPASRTEKLATNIILSHFYYPILLVAVSCLGILASSFICYFIYDGFSLKNIGIIAGFENSASEIWYIVLFFMLNNAVMMFGSVYFKRAAVIKTLLCEAAFIFVLTVVSLVIVFKMYDGIPVLIEGLKGANVILSVFVLCVTLFFWVLSYFRLKETEA